jgi:uncharacterized protein YeaO (DUF488 family)
MFAEVAGGICANALAVHDPQRTPNRGDHHVLRLKRAYEPASSTDGRRILVDRLWPRGLSRKKAAIDEWVKDVAPSAALRKWFGHDPAKWPEFRRRYRHELTAHPDIVRAIASLASRRRVTLVFSARDELHNDAVVLAAAVRMRMKRVARQPRATARRARAKRE